MQQAAIAHFPRLPLSGAIAVVLFTLLSVSAARIAGIAPAAQPSGDKPVQSRSLIFEDKPTGGIEVRDAATGFSIATVMPGTNGFLRGALRGFARARKRDSGEMTSPFLLQSWPDRHLTLTDPTNGAVIDLLAFGPTNAQVFAAFLPDQKGARQ